jgi:hypothetical protein
MHALLVAAPLLLCAPVFTFAPAQAAEIQRPVILIGNSVSGTVSFLDGTTFENLGSINVAADAQTRINAFNPVERVGYEGVLAAEGGQIRYTDDMYTSPDGRTLYVSRGELQDVAAYDIATKRQIWRTKIDGFKTDHAILSPDGTQFIVSATTAQKAFVLNTATGAVVTSFPTGTYPHGNDYSPDGRFLYNSSIGVTSLPKSLNLLKGAKTITKVDAKTYRVLKTYTFDYGVRPAVFTRDNKYAYIQLSYLNGFIEYDLTTGTTLRTIQMPFSTAGRALAQDSYPQNSAHHGMAISGDESKLCEVGTIDDYTAIVPRPALTGIKYVNYAAGSIPYWSTTSRDGNYCLVSLSGKNQVSVVDYRTGAEVKRVGVGTFPQRERLGTVAQSVVATLSPAAG